MTMGALRLGALCLLVALAASAPASSQPEAPPFRVEWVRRDTPGLRPAVEGYVYNDSVYRVSNIRLRVESIDGSGQVVRSGHSWIYGSVDAGGRGYFVLPMPRPGETYRIGVESFDRMARQAP